MHFSFSRKIAALGTQDDPMPKAKQIQLQNYIRMGATNYLKQNMLGLPSLPNQEELVKLQEERRLEIQRRIEQEKRIVLEEQIRSSPSRPPRRSVAYRKDGNDYEENVVSPDTGWGPEMRNASETSPEQHMDPMLQQINIIRNYIKQARDAHKYDEVHMLEENLKELEIEYFVQQHGDQHATADVYSNGS